MKVLVTGGTGFTGSHVVRRLVSNGDDVVCLDNQPGLFAEELRELGVDLRIGSVTDRDLVRRCTEGVEVVHHLDSDGVGGPRTRIEVTLTVEGDTLTADFTGSASQVRPAL